MTEMTPERARLIRERWREYKGKWPKGVERMTVPINQAVSVLEAAQFVVFHTLTFERRRDYYWGDADAPGACMHSVWCEGVCVNRVIEPLRRAS